MTLEWTELLSCDTVGILTPERSAEFFSKLKENIKVPVGVHCHNDFGMAVANSVAALGAGAEEVHATINGLGERAGNASLEEIVAHLKITLQTGPKHQNRTALRHIPAGFQINRRLRAA